MRAIVEPKYERAEECCRRTQDERDVRKQREGKNYGMLARQQTNSINGAEERRRYDKLIAIVVVV